MGLILAAVAATASTLGDQWKEFIYCDALPANVLMVKGRKKQNFLSSNKFGSDNVITEGSLILVNEGQCMIIVEQGKVVDFTAVAGQYTFDSSTEPSMFNGNLGEGIKETLKTIGKRFTFGGTRTSDQRVYFVNTKELVGCKFGTATPVPMRIVDNNIGLDLDSAVRCNGTYSFRIADPIKFYTNLAGNVERDYTLEDIDGMMKSEFLSALQPAFAKISDMGVRYSQIPGATTELCQALKEALAPKWSESRGIEICSVAINAIKASDEDEQMIKNLQKAAVNRNAGMAAATITDAQAEAMKAAASNTATGPMMAFAGMNMAQQAGGVDAGQLFQMQQQQMQQMQQQQMAQMNQMNQMNQQPAAQMAQQQGQPAAAQPGEWFCPQCGTKNSGNFCPACGTKKPF
ncbi:MAG: SPFH domain-containing protein [Lachnospiraceae bacterium]|nr:SPFH domain-containing protein [Lachnospiraceae bacterium]